MIPYLRDNYFTFSSKGHEFAKLRVASKEIGWKNFQKVGLVRE